jgi:hypothetical protein
MKPTVNRFQWLGLVFTELNLRLLFPETKVIFPKTFRTSSHVSSNGLRNVGLLPNGRDWSPEKSLLLVAVKACFLQDIVVSVLR